MTSPTPIVSAHVARRFSKASGTYDANAMLQRQIMQTAFGQAEKYFAANAEILDLGCGTGSFARYAKPRHAEWVVDGLDVAPGMIEHARPYYRRMIEAPMEKIPLPDASYNAIFSSLALQWVGDPIEALSEIARVLAPNGVAVVTAFGQQTLRELRAATEEVKLPATVIPMHDTVLYRGWAKEAGLQMVSLRRTEEVHRMPKVSDLFMHLRAIGATNQLRTRPRHFASPSQFRELIQLYTQYFGDARGIPVTWDTLFFVLRKPAS